MPNYGTEEQVKPGQAGQPLFNVGSEGNVGKVSEQHSYSLSCFGERNYVDECLKHHSKEFSMNN